MKIAVYCQHVLGVGHFHRSLELCRALALQHRVTMILGGPEVSFIADGFTVFKLPGLEMDHDFKNLQPCDRTNSLEEVKKSRASLLLQLFEQEHFDTFITELYPFGRKAFRFELDPLLSAIKDGPLSPCRVLCSLRDILVERKEDTEKFENRVIRKLARFYNGILIHSDPAFIRIEETFHQADSIPVPYRYTGFINRQDKTHSAFQPPQKENTKLIVASIGGGNVGEELLFAAAEAVNLDSSRNLFLQIFTGLYSDEKVYEALKCYENERIQVSRFSSDFKNWLAHADLSLSMAGYNSCMDVLSAGTIGLLYPFNQNQEQRLRVQKFESRTALQLLEKEDLKPEALLARINAALSAVYPQSSVNLDGAASTLHLVTNWE